MIARRPRRTKFRKPARNEAHELLMKQADIPAAQASRRMYEVVPLAEDPGGDVIIRGDVKRHEAVRVRLAWREMLARGTFKSANLDGKPVQQLHIEAALIWYQERLDAAESYSVKSGLDFSGGGGAPSSHIPTHEAAIFAQADVAWARSIVSTQCLAVFDAVMRDGTSLIETARRLSGARHLSGTVQGRAALNRARERAARQFVQACSELAHAHHLRMVPQGDGRIRVS